MLYEPEKLDLRSADIAEDRRQELLRLFPEIRTQGGKLDFERLKLALGEAVDAGKERYGMTWPGKADCFKTIQAPSLGTLRPCPEESVNFDTTENLIIEGDNLEVLKLLQKSYLGKVKMIYIDPPYNTGNDFIYPDNYTESLQTYLEYTGQVDAEGKKFGTNSDTDGRFHSKWLNMMYPRLYLARNLLRDDGVVFVSIDDTEFTQLRYLCDEVFGEENFVAALVWKKSYGGGAKTKYVVGLHEYVVAYSRDKEALGTLELPPNPAVLKYYKFRDDKFEARGPYRTQPLATTSMDDRPNLRFPISWHEYEIWPDKQWQWSRERVEKALAADELVIANRSGKWVVDYKQYLKDKDGQERSAKPFSIIEGPYTQIGTKELRELSLDDAGFSFPKPVGLVTELIQYCGQEAIVLDFFAGSGTTAHAVLDLNKLDGGNRKFILVQLPEPTGREDYLTIAEITKERVRRVIQKIARGDAENAENRSQPELFSSVPSAPPRESGLGFRVFKLAESNFKPWNAEVPHDVSALERQLGLHIDHIREGRTSDDLLYEILLKSGFPITTPVEKLTLEGKTVHSVAGGALFICLEWELSLELIRAMAEEKPKRVVCLDEGFAANDQLKANAVQLFKTKGVTSFKTV
jgi:adenine-specific DNA-methyltransferase